MEKTLQQMKLALEKFSAFEDQTGTAMEEMKSSMAALEERMSWFSRTRDQDPKLGFWDSNTQANQFVDYMRDMWNHGGMQGRAMNEGTAADGGTIVPEEFVPTLLRFIETYGVTRQYARVIPMAREEMRFPKLTNGVAVYWPGENAAINESQPSFGDVLLKAKKLAALVPASSELVEDSVIAIATLLASLVGEAMGKEEDRVAFMGDITGLSDPFDGVLFDSTVQSVVMDSGDTLYSDLNADYLLSMTTAIPTSATAGARYFFHRTVFNIVRTLKDQQGNYIFNPPAGTVPGTIWGYPYTLVETMPTTAVLLANQPDTPFVIFGNLQNLYFGDRMNITAAVSPHFKFNLDQLYFRYIERFAIKVAMGAGLCTLKTSAT